MSVLDKLQRVIEKDLPIIVPNKTFTDIFKVLLDRDDVYYIQSLASEGIIYNCQSLYFNKNNKNCVVDVNLKTLQKNVINVDKNQTKKIELKQSENVNVLSLLVRPDLFPVSKVPLYRIFFTSVAQYSSTPFIATQKMYSRIKSLIKDESNIILFDGTACVGTDIINLASMDKDITLIGCELDKLNYKCLLNNWKLFGFKNSHQFMNDDTIDLLLNNKETLLYKPNVMYFDPPWGGVNYKTQKSVDLKLGDIDIFKLVDKLIDKYNSLQVVVLKLPFNFNRDNKYYKNLLSVITEDAQKNIVYLYVNVEVKE